MSKKLGGVLARLRKNSELTQRQVAEVLNIERSTYAYYERGTTEPDLNAMVTLSKIFKVDINTILVYAGKSESAIADNETDDAEEREKIYELTKKEQDLLIVYRVLSDKEKQKLYSCALEAWRREQQGD